MSKKKRKCLTGVEIGTSAVKVVMGELLPDDVIAIVGVGELPSLKVVKGEVVDANVVQEQVERALAMAEEASGEEIEEIFLAASGGHVRTVNSVGSTMVHASAGKVSEEDVVIAARNARAYALPPDKEVLHYFDRYYTIDGNREVVNPIGQAGAKLEADTHIVYGQHNRFETNCGMIADVMGYPARDVAFSGIAAGFAVFSREEIEKGGLLIDIGAGVTEYVVFHGTGCFHSGQLTIGCEHVVNDLSLGLRLPLPKCRKILHDLAEFGSAVMTPDGRSRLMSAGPLGQPPRRIPISTIEQIVELRLQELFETILADLRASRALERVSSGVRLSGGGAHIAGVDRLAQNVLRMPATMAKPRLLSGEHDTVNDPRFVTPVGLIRWGKLALEIGERSPAPVWEQIRGDAKNVLHLLRRSIRW